MTHRIATRRNLRFPLSPLLCLLVSTATCPADSAASELSDTMLIARGVNELLAMQEPDGAWPYEGVYRVHGQIPIGYRVAGTALVCQALLHAASAERSDVAVSMARGVERILIDLQHPLMLPSVRDAYDVRVWGHCHALELFCLLRASGRLPRYVECYEPWIPRLVAALLAQELPGGGWNYAHRRAPASFVTAPVAQTLLLARGLGEAVPDEVLIRTLAVLSDSRLEDGTFLYSNVRSRVDPARIRDRLPGSIARAAVCESTMLSLGGGELTRLAAALEAFHTHWDELEKRRKQTGTHVPPYGIAPYYFFYGHRYAAQAIHWLPPERRPAERGRLRELLLRTRDPEGTWNDRVFPRSRNYGTAMAVMALLGERVPLPMAGG